MSDEVAETTVVEEVAPDAEAPDVAVEDQSIETATQGEPHSRQMRRVPAETPGDVTHPLVRMAMLDAGKLTTESIGQLMALQREWQASEAKRSFTRDLVAMKRELPSVINRDKTVRYEQKNGDVTTYTHASLALVVDAVTPILCKYGFSVAFKTGPGERGKVAVNCTLTHQDGHEETATLEAAPDDSGRKSPGQAVASTVTLLERHAMLALLGIATKEHTDPEPRVESQPTKTVDEIIAAFKAAKVPGDVAKATKEWTRIASTLAEADKAELSIERGKAIQRIEEAKS